MSDFKYSLTNLKPVEPVNKVNVTFPDGATREFPQGITGLDIAKGISPSLAKRTVAMALDGSLADLNDPIEQDAKIEFVACPAGSVTLGPGGSATSPVLLLHTTGVSRFGTVAGNGKQPVGRFGPRLVQVTCRAVDAPTA